MDLISHWELHSRTVGDFLRVIPKGGQLTCHHSFHPSQKGWFSCFVSLRTCSLKGSTNNGDNMTSYLLLLRRLAKRHDPPKHEPRLRSLDFRLLMGTELTYFTCWTKVQQGITSKLELVHYIHIHWVLAKISYSRIKRCSRLWLARIFLSNFHLICKIDKFDKYWSIFIWSIIKKFS